MNPPRLRQLIQVDALLCISRQMIYLLCYFVQIAADDSSYLLVLYQELFSAESTTH